MRSRRSSRADDGESVSCGPRTFPFCAISLLSEKAHSRWKTRHARSLRVPPGKSFDRIREKCAMHYRRAARGPRQKVVKHYIAASIVLLIAAVVYPTVVPAEGQG